MSDMDPSSLKAFAVKTLVAAGIVMVLVIAALALHRVATIVLMVFAGILFAVFLDGIASWVRRRTPVPRWVALTLVIAVILAAAFFIVWFAGPPFANQMTKLANRIGSALTAIQASLSNYQWGRTLLDEFTKAKKTLPLNSSFLAEIGLVFSTVLAAAGSVLLVFFVGIYAAINPGLYVNNVIKLVPKPRRARAHEVARALGKALRWWLAGRLITMTMVGILTTVGLYIIGLPMALTLGFIGGAFTFVPFLGPVVAAVPAVLVGFAESPMLAVWVIVVYLAVHGFEAYLLTPLIQERAVSIAPALLLGVQIMMGILYGILGVLLATPMTVVVIVLIQTLYVEDVLHDHVRLMGEH